MISNKIFYFQEEIILYKKFYIASHVQYNAMKQCGNKIKKTYKTL